MRKHSLYLLLVVGYSLIIQTIVFSQSYFFRNYSVDNGLPFVQVSAIYQDSKGNLWTGGYGGLSKFDGTFKNYGPKNGLIHHSVTCITEDKQGSIWIGTIKGISRLEKGKFTSYTTKEGLSDNNIRACLTDREGNEWFATGNGLTKYNGRRFEIITTENGLPSNDIISVYQDSLGIMWFGTSRGLSSCSGKKITNYTTLNGLPGNYIQSITGDKHGNLWVGTNNGLSIFNKTKFENYFTENGLPDNNINVVRMDARNNMWVGTNKGLCKVLNKEGAIFFKKYHLSDVSNSRIINSMTSDYEGNFWVGTHNGLYRYRADVFALYSEKEGLQNTFIYQILRDKNKNLFVGTQGGGFYLYDGSNFSNFSTKEGLCDNTINAAVLDKENRLWIGTNKGLSRFDGRAFQNYSRKDGLSCDSVTAVFIDDKGVLWLGGKNSITLYDGKKFKKLLLPESGESAGVWAIMEDQNKTIWIGTYLGGLYKYEQGKMIACSAQTGINSNSVLSIVQNKTGDLFFGTLDGVFMLSPAVGGVPAMPAIHFDESDGMSSDLVYVVLLDDKGFLWAGTNQGINKINITEFKKNGKKIVEPYTKEDGFQGVECNSNGAFKDSDGALWFGTVNGLIKYLPAEDIENTLEPRTTITSITLAEHDTLLPDFCKLPYDLNTITFKFIGICLSNPYKVHYQYKLEGIDKQWSAVTTENFIKYSGLPPGNYQFKVISSNNENVWNKTPLVFSFFITPPFWKTAWFRILTTVGVTGLVFLFIYYRVNQVRVKERQRSDLQKRIAGIELLGLRYQMNPHFIFNTMSSIQHYISNNEPDAALKYLSRFAKLMRAIMENSKQSTITVKVELDTLKLYLELESMRFAGKFEYTFRIDPKIDVNYEEIPSMLIQPYVENAIIHGLLPKAKNGKLFIDLTKNDNFIICTIEDDGIGRSKAEELNKSRVSQHRSLGMSITKERLSILNHINSNNNSLSEKITDLFDEKGNPAGTRVVIYIPLEIT